jgi:hypothetical protein
MSPVYAPLAEMLAVVIQEVIAVLTDTSARAAHYFTGVEVGCPMLPDPERTPVCEARKGNFLDRAARQVTCHASVVNDLSIANIDTVMGKAETRCNEM